MKTIFSSVAFQDEAGNVLANGSLVLTLPPGVYLAAGAQVVGLSKIVNLDATGKVPAGTTISASDELVPQTPYTVTICALPNGVQSVASATWLIVGASPIDLSHMISLPLLFDVVPGGSLTLQAAYNAKVAAGGGTVNVPPGYSETLLANLVMNANNTGFRFWGPATITMGSFSVIISPGVNGGFIKAPATSTLVPSPGVQFIYTGTGKAFDIGDGTANTQGLRFENFVVLTTTAGSSAIAMSLRRVVASIFHGLSLFGPNGVTSQIGLLLDGTGGGFFTGDNLFEGCIINSFLSNVQFANTANVNIFLAGESSTTATSGISLDFQNGSGNVVTGMDIESTPTAVNFANSANVTNNQVQAWFEANTVDVSFGASSGGNIVDSLTGPLKVTGAGGGANNNLVKGTVKGTLLNQQGPSGAITGTGSDATVFSFAIPANTIGPGKGIRITIATLKSTGTTSTSYKLKFGSTVFDSFAYAANGNVLLDVYTYEIYNNVGVQNSQWFLSKSAINLTGSAQEVPSSRSGTGSIDFTQPQTVSWTFNVANTDAETPKAWAIELIQ